MPLPSMKEQFAALIAAPSVSCTQASLDQTNRPVIDQSFNKASCVSGQKKKKK